MRRRLEQLVETLNQDITELDKEILELVQVSQQVSGEHSGEGTDSTEGEVDTKWKAAIALLVTIPGIALLTACWLLVATLNFTLCQSAQAPAHYVGLAPLMREPRSKCSGSSPDWP